MERNGVRELESVSKNLKLGKRIFLFLYKIISERVEMQIAKNGIREEKL